MRAAGNFRRSQRKRNQTVSFKGRNHSWTHGANLAFQCIYGWSNDRVIHSAQRGQTLPSRVLCFRSRHRTDFSCIMVQFFHLQLFCNAVFLQSGCSCPIFASKIWWYGKNYVSDCRADADYSGYIGPWLQYGDCAGSKEKRENCINGRFPDWRYACHTWKRNW